jgi:hypothetical protein
MSSVVVTASVVVMSSVVVIASIVKKCKTISIGNIVMKKAIIMLKTNNTGSSQGNYNY